MTGANTINVGSTAGNTPASPGNLNGIQGALTITGTGNDTLNTDDSGDAGSSTGTLTSDTLNGLTMGGSGIAYTGIANLNIYLGSHGNTFYVQSTSQTTLTTLNDGSGANTINLGSNAGAPGPLVNGNAPNTGSVLDNVLGNLIINGSGSDTLNLDDTGSTVGKTLTMTASTITFVGLGTITYSGISSINISLGQGADLVAILDTPVNASVTPAIVINGDGGGDTFNVFDSHAVMTINGGDGNDTFYVFGNSSVLNLNGNGGNNTFALFASVISGQQNYRANAPVNIDGGTGGNNTFAIYGTVLNDVFTINGTPFASVGLNVTYVNITGWTVIGLGGNNTFYVETTSIPTTLVGDGSLPAFDLPPGVSAPNLTGGATATSFNNTFYIGWQGKYIPGSLAGIDAPLTITNAPQPGTGSKATANVDDSGDMADQSFTLTSTTLNSSAMGPAGQINYDPTINNLNIQAGSGDDNITVNGTGAGTETTINGGPGNDIFVVNAPLTTPLAIIGGTNTFDGDTLTVNGAAGGTNFVITGFTINGTGAIISYQEIEYLTVQAIGGNNTFTLNGDSVPTDLIGGPGNDTFVINSNIVPAVLTGGAGNDIFTINANSGTLTITGATQGDAFTVNGNSGTLNITGSASAQSGDLFTINGNGGLLTVNGGAGTDIFVVNAIGAPAILNAGSGKDTFTANAPLAASLTVNGVAGLSDVLTVNATEGNDFITITGNSVSGPGAPIYYNNLSGLIVNGLTGTDTFLIVSDSANTTVNGGAGNDTFYVQSTSAPLVINTGGGTNVVDIGSTVPYPGSVLTGIQALVTVTGDGKDTLNVDDSGDLTGETGTLTSTTVIGLGMGASGITYSGLAMLNIKLGSGNDIFNIQSTQAGTSTMLNTGAGSNIVNVGSLAPVSGGIVDEILGALNVVGNGTDTLNVDDTGSTANKTGTLTSTTLTGLGMGASGITYGGLKVLNIKLSSGSDTFLIVSNSVITMVNGGSGNDTFYVQTTSAPLTINTGGGINVVDIGSMVPNAGSVLDGIQGQVNVVGDGSDTLNVDDTGSTANKTGTLTATTLTGLGMGAGGITYSGLKVINVNLGSGTDTFLIVSDSANTTVNGGAGNDTFYVQSTSTPLVINTGGGTNVVDIGSTVPNAGSVLTGIQAQVTVTGNGKDTLNVDDSGDLTGETGTLTSTTVTGLGMGVSGITYSGLAALNIKLGSGNDIFNIQSTKAGTSTMLNTGAGSNTVNVGSLAPVSGGIVDEILGALTVVGSGTDTLNVDDTGSTANKTGTLTSTTLTGLGMGVSGITYSGISALNINLGSGDDVFNIQSTNASTSTVLNTGAGSNTVNIGSLAPLAGGIVDNIHGAVNVVGNGSDTLNVDDTGSTANKTGTLTATILTGLGMGAGGISYSGLKVLNVNLGSGNDTFLIVSDSANTTVNGGAGNDTFYVQSTSAPLVINTGGGTNVVDIGSTVPYPGSVLTGIQALVTVTGDGKDTLNVDDSGDLTGETGTLTSTTVTGLGMGASGITYSGLAALNIKLGSGNDIFNIQSTKAGTSTMLNTGAGSNTVNVGSLAPVSGGIVDEILGALNVVGSGTDTLNVDDTGSTANKTGTLTSTTLTGLGMGVSGITYSGISALNINLGSGNDVFNITSTNASTSTVLNTGTGSDTVNIGSRAPLSGGIVDNIRGSVNVVGGGNDTLNVDDSGSTVNKTGTLTPTTLTGLAMGAGGITYSGLSALNIKLGSGNDLFTINDITNSMVTTINGGAGSNSAILNFSHDFASEDLTLLNFQNAFLAVGGNFTGVLNDAGTIQSVTIVGSFTTTGRLNAGTIGTMTIGGDLAGVLTVTGLLNTLTVGGGTPGEIIAGSIHTIIALNAYGNKVLQVIEGGIQRQIQATPVAGGVLPNTVKFEYIYDDLTTPGSPQLAIRITNGNTVPVRFDLSLVTFSGTAKFNLALVFANGSSGIRNVTVEGDILTKVSQPALTLFHLPVGSRSGVVLPKDNIAGVEVRDTLPVGVIDVAGIEGVAFATLLNAKGAPITLTSDLGSETNLSVIWGILGSKPVLLAATDIFRVPFGPNHSVNLYVQDDNDADLDLVMTFTDKILNNASVTAYLQLQPGHLNAENPIIQSVNLIGDGGSFTTPGSVANITSTGALGNVIVGGPNGIGSITAPSIFGNIEATTGAISGIIQTTGIRIDPITGAQTTVNADLGATSLGANGIITGVTVISAKLGMTGEILSRGNLISRVSIGGTFGGVIAAQGDIGAIQRNSNGNAVVSSLGHLSLFGGITIGGGDSGQIIALGNIFGSLSINGVLTGGIAAQGRAVAGLAASRFGILGNVTTNSTAAGSAIVSGGVIGDVTGQTTFFSRGVLGLLAAKGVINLAKGTPITSSNCFQNAGAPGNLNGPVIDAIFTNNSNALVFDINPGDLQGLELIETDLRNIKPGNHGVLTGTIP